MEEYLESAAPVHDVAELIAILVRDCGCGCAAVEASLISSEAGCTAVGMLLDRPFVLGVLFARTLRERLEDEEWCRPITEHLREGLAGRPL